MDYSHVLDLAKKYGKKKSYPEYEKYKQIFYRMNLTPDEYKDAIKKLSQILGL